MVFLNTLEANHRGYLIMKKEYMVPEVIVEDIMLEDIIAASFGSDLAGDLKQSIENLF